MYHFFIFYFYRINLKKTLKKKVRMQIYFPKQQRPFFFSMTLTHHTRQREERGERREEGERREGEMVPISTWKQSLSAFDENKNNKWNNHSSMRFRIPIGWRVRNCTDWCWYLSNIVPWMLPFAFYGRKIIK